MLLTTAEEGTNTYKLCATYVKMGEGLMIEFLFLQ